MYSLRYEYIALEYIKNVYMANQHSHNMKKRQQTAEIENVQNNNNNTTTGNLETIVLLELFSV